MLEGNFLVALAVCSAAALSTVLGALFVVFAREPNPRLLSFGLAFAGGAMVYVSLVEIFLKSESAFAASFDVRAAHAFATLSFFGGILLIAGVDRFIPNPHGGMVLGNNGEQGHIARVGLLAALAITAHNLPEGLATFLATLQNPVVGVPLAVAIAIHNIPEGVSIAIPVFYATGSKQRALIATGVSALAEPAGALIGYTILAPFLSEIAFAIVFGMIAGVMVFLALDELLPTAKRYARGHETVYGMVIGMAALATSLVMFK